MSDFAEKAAMMKEIMCERHNVEICGRYSPICGCICILEIGHLPKDAPCVHGNHTPCSPSTKVDAPGFSDAVRNLFAHNAERANELPNLLDGTQYFMELAGQIRHPILEPGSNWTDTDRVLRQDLLREEFKEYWCAEMDEDHVEIVDGLLDIIVIAWGTLLNYIGPEKAEAAAAEVVRSNLSKVDGSLGPIIRRDDGKVLKPEGWTPPDIEGVLS
jgi:hypothetical protein